jgi:hypothetical protein
VPCIAWTETAAQAIGGIIFHGRDKTYWLGDNILAVP